MKCYTNNMKDVQDNWTDKRHYINYQSIKFLIFIIIIMIFNLVAARIQIIVKSMYDIVCYRKQKLLMSLEKYASFVSNFRFINILNNLIFQRNNLYKEDLRL